MYIAERSITATLHPAYSAHLALSVYWLFDFLKEPLESCSDEKSSKRADSETLKNIPEDVHRSSLKIVLRE